MLSLAVRTLRARRVSFAGSFLALCLATTLLTAMGLALDATLDPPRHRPERFAAAPAVVRGQDTLRVETEAGVRTRPLTSPRTLPAATVAALRTVGDVVEDRSFAVRVDGGPGDLVGHPWPVARFAPYRLDAGRAPRAADEVVAAGGWTAVGRRLRSDHGTLRVVGTVHALGAENPVFFTDARAARLAPGVVQLVADADPVAVRRAVGAADGVRVLTGDARRFADPDPGRDARALTALNALFGTAGGVSGFVSVLVVASTFAFTVAQRSREFGLLRAAGATPGQVRRTVLAEALLVGIAASVAGCALGAYGAPLLVTRVVEGGLAPGWFRLADLSWHAWPYQLAFWTGLLVALSGAAAAAWRAGRTAPTQALREASVDGRTLTWGRRVCGTALLLAAAATLAHTLLTDPGDLLHRKTYVSRPLLLIGALALLSPALLRPSVRLLAWLPARLPGALGMLARENTATSLRRTAAVAAPVLATVALTGCLLGTPATLEQARAAESDRATVADFVVVPESHARGDASDGIGTATVDRLRSIPGATVCPVRGTAVHTLEGGVALVTSSAHAADPPAPAATVRLPVTAGRIADLDDASIVVNEEWAEHTVGRHVTVWLGDGTRRTLRIAAVLATGTGDNGAWLTPANAPGAPVERLDVRVRAGADAAAVATALRATVRPGDGVRVLTRAQWLHASRPVATGTTRLGLFLVLGIALLYTGLSLANTLTMSTSGRAAEFTALRLAGATRGQILRLTALESLTVVAAGALLGLLVTFVTWAGTGAALGLLSAPVPLVLPWPALGAATAGCALLAVVSSTVTTAAALRR
ncbi:ABC transporter permease [Streptomyces sp. NPDC014006]|uniref:ABC transporter permease n=1 Tax=Streptomyces sp. NPDC014006 TaxID=3364870 RepID=UPI0037004D8C